MHGRMPLDTVIHKVFYLHLRLGWEYSNDELEAAISSIYQGVSWNGRQHDLSTTDSPSSQITGIVLKRVAEPEKWMA